VASGRGGNFGAPGSSAFQREGGNVATGGRGGPPGGAFQQRGAVGYTPGVGRGVVPYSGVTPHGRGPPPPPSYGGPTTGNYGPR
jgi:hypothetical protein